MEKETASAAFESIRDSVNAQLERYQKYLVYPFRFPEPLETQFRSYYHHDNLFYALVSIGMGVALLSVSLLVTLLLARPSVMTTSLMHLSLITYLFVAWAAFYKYSTSYLHNVFAAVNIIIVCFVLNMIAFREQDIFKFVYYSSTSIVFFTGFLMFRLPFMWSVRVGVFCILMFALCAVMDTGLTFDAQIGLTTFSISSLAIAYCIVYLMERSVRIQFLQSQLLGIQQVDLHRANSRLKTLIELDTLTQISNRRGFDNKLEAEWKRSLKRSHSVALILFDVDYFKQYNDTYGHDLGDKCLQSLAEAVDSTLTRPTDLLARYGGEEFAVLLPETGLDDAVYVAERIRHCVVELKIPHISSGIAKHVTVSCGVAVMVPSEKNHIDDLIQQADHALYTSKYNGRNRSSSFCDLEYTTEATVPTTA
ncbi:MAG: diguanylate cyclase [Pseudomonadota bacterium]